MKTNLRFLVTYETGTYLVFFVISASKITYENNNETHAKAVRKSINQNDL